MDAAHKSKTVQVRVPNTLWLRFKSACHSNDTNPSEALREFMRMFVRQEAEVRGVVDQAESNYNARFTSPSEVAASMHKEQHVNSNLLWNKEGSSQ